MTQNDINRAVATATGETVDEIQRRGFSVVDDVDVSFDPEPSDDSSPYLDWDALDLARNVAPIQDIMRAPVFA